MGVLSAAAAPLRAGTRPGRTLSCFATGRVSQRVRITPPPTAARCGTRRRRCRRAGRGGAIGRASATAAHRRRRRGRPIKCLRCSPGGSPPRASRGPCRLTPWLRSSGRVAARSEARRSQPPAAPSLRAGGARKRACLWPSAQRRKADSRCMQPPRQAVGASAAPSRRGVVTALAQSRSLSRRLHAPAEPCRGGETPPRDPPPPRGRGSRAQHLRPAMPATASRPAPLRPLPKQARGAAQRGRPERAWLRHRPGAPREGFLRAPRPGGPSCDPAALPGRLAQAAPDRPGCRPRPGASVTARRVAGGPPGRQPGAAGSHDAGRHRSKQARGDSVPPWTPRASAQAGAATKARTKRERGLRRTGGTPAGARLAGRPSTWSGTAASVTACAAAVGSAASTPLRAASAAGPSGPEVDPTDPQPQPAKVAAAQRAPGAFSHSANERTGQGQPTQASKGGAPPPLDPGPARILRRKG